MIINHPTGFYASVLPSGNDAGNVTFTISNTLPPRSDLLVQKVPLGIVYRKRTQIDQNVANRRKSFGDLIFSVSKSRRIEEGNNSRQYEIGQVLEFNQQSGKSVEPMLVSEVTEIRHNTNKLDYEMMGLTEQEQEILAEASLLTKEAITSSLNDYRQKRSDSEQSINDNQKIINDLTKTIDSLTITLDYTNTTTTEESTIINQMIIKLKSKRDTAFVERDKAIELANFYAQESSKLVDQLRSVGLLVK